MRPTFVPKQTLGLLIPDGAAGTRETLKHMRKLAQAGKRDPFMRDTAQQITAHLPGKAFEAEIAALFEFVRSNIRYALDTNEIEVIQSPQVTLQLGYGDCDDFCVLLATLLECCGHPAAFVALGFEPEPEYSHVIVRTLAAGNGGFIYLDATEPNPPGWYPPGVQWRMVADV